MRFLGSAVCLVSASLLSAQSAPAVRVTAVTGPISRIDGATDVIGASVGPDGLLLVDVGYPQATSAVRAALRGLGSESPRIVINTHWHHTFANDSFARGAVVVAHRRVRDRMTQANDMAGRTIPPSAPGARPAVTFEDSLTLTFNGERISLFHVPRAHTDGDIIVLFHGSRVAFTGDVFVPHLPWIDAPSGGHLDGLLQATDFLLRVLPRDVKIVPGHGATSSYDDVVRFREMLTETIAHVRRHIEAGRTSADIQAAGVPERWRSWEGDVPARMFLDGVYRGLTKRAPDLLTPPALELRNGRWFNGRVFEPTTWYAVDGLLRQSRPARIDSVIDLAGRFIVPPYADAHVHDLNDSATVATDVASYRRRGVFYALEADPIVRPTPFVQSAITAPGGPDVAYVEAVITPSWGMIAEMYRMLAARGRFGPGATLESIATPNLFVVDDSADLARQWPVIGARGGTVKVILGFSEQFASRRAQAAAGSASGAINTGAPGFDPRLLPDLAARTRAAGQRLMAHVETAEDFRRAVNAGVGIVAHWPGAWQIGAPAGLPDTDLTPWLLTDDDARQAARRQVIVVSTVARGPAPRPNQRLIDSLHRRNLATLARHQVRIAIGSDVNPGNPVAEARYLAALGSMDRPAILRVLVQDTPRAIFPDRNVGRFADGYEASLLALDGDPLLDLANLDRIALRLKRGMVVNQ